MYTFRFIFPQDGSYYKFTELDNGVEFGSGMPNGITKERTVELLYDFGKTKSGERDSRWSSQHLWEYPTYRLKNTSNCETE